MPIKSLLASATLAAAFFATNAAATTTAMHATQVWAQHGQYNTGAIPDHEIDPDNARSGSDSFFRMGLGGLALFAFGGEITGSSVVFETTYGCRDGAGDGLCDSYKEQIDVYVLDAGFDPSSLVAMSQPVPGGSRMGYDLQGLIGSPHAWKVAENLGNHDAQSGAPIDLTQAALELDEPLFYILVHDRSLHVNGRVNSREGFDIQQVTAHVAAVPLPAGAALLLGGFGVAALIRRRSA
ncbi:MAG: VPLPA-CTERM sorting domain-containing protein [Pseudomonadota bacterium]